MLEKMSVLLVLYTIILAYDLPRLKQKQTRERLAYGAFMLLALYFSVDYVSSAELPNVYSVVYLLLIDTAKQIVGYLKAGTP